MKKFPLFSLTSVIIIIFFSLSFGCFSQEVLWEVTLGGEHSEYLYDMQGTPDYGFLVAGSTLSEDSGNKEGKSKGDLDYLLWKLDENGYTQWQKSFGGAGQDYLYSVETTRDGGFILGGSTTTGKDGDKTSENFGSEDYWVLKLNAKAEIEWQQSYGGMGQDKLLSISQTQDGGYIIGGNSDSDKSEEIKDKNYKSENSRGNQDYWVIKTDSQGKVEWQKTYGGEYYDLLRSIKPTHDGGYILGGYSNSPISGDKTEDNKGIGDYWILKLNETGEIEWQQTLGGNKDDQLYDLIITKDKGYLLSGNSNSNRGEDKTSETINGTDWWVLKFTQEGEVEWQQSYNIASSDILLSVEESEDKDGNTTYLLAGYAQSSSTAQKAKKEENNYIAIKIDEKGEELWRKSIGGKGVDKLQTLTETRDGGYVLAGTSDSPKSEDKGIEAKGQNDFYLVKLLDKDKVEQSERIAVEIYPNPTKRYTTVLINETLPKENKVKISVLDLNGALLQTYTINQNTLTLDLYGYQPGVYLVKVQVNGKEQTFKVLKEGSL